MYRKERLKVRKPEHFAIKVIDYYKNMFTGQRAPSVNKTLDLLHQLGAHIEVEEWNYSYDRKPKGSRVVTSRRLVESCRVTIQLDDREKSEFQQVTDCYFYSNFWQFAYKALKSWLAERK